MLQGGRMTDRRTRETGRQGYRRERQGYRRERQGYRREWQGYGRGHQGYKDRKTLRTMRRDDKQGRNWMKTTRQQFRETEAVDERWK